ncbi:MAG: biotin--[acetyl-CoA-carboxylase] ligase [Actinobacteria bacterium]|nr:biotin--[acetyl-CoA-carboxylase] ligase [Actinomycetota bacterium]
MLFLDCSLRASVDCLFESSTQIVNLACSGMNITAHSRTVPLVEPLDIAEIISALDPGYWRVQHFNLIDSTQRSLVSAVIAGEAEAGDVYLAEYQSAGRGRGARSFESAAGDGMLLSAVISPKSQSENRWGWVPLIVGVAACAAIMKSTGVQSVLKWPNDLLVADEKVGGVIAEKVNEKIVIGIGINCLQEPGNLPAIGATSLRIHSAEPVNRNLLVANFLNELDRNISSWEEKPFPVENRYRQLCSTLERDIRLLLPDGSQVTGRAAAISTSGALVLADGREFVAADVTHLRLDK